MKPCQVVVVEDDRELGELVLEALGMELDCEMRLIVDGTEALEWLSSDFAHHHPPGLMILDVHLPGVSGLHLLDYIRSHESFTATRVVVTTADSMLLEKARHKADWLLLKPVAYSHFAEISRWYSSQCDREPTPVMKSSTRRSDSP